MDGSENCAGGRKRLRLRFPGILLLLLLWTMAGRAEEIPSWLRALQGAEGFEQTDGTWVYQQSAEYLFTDGRAFFGLEGATYAETGEVLICAFTGLSDRRDQPLADVTRFDVLIGEQVWSWHAPVVGSWASFAYLGEAEKDFLDALAGADSLYVQVHFLARKMLISFDGTELEKLREAAALLSEAMVAVDTGSESVTGRYETEHPVHRKGGVTLPELSR